MMKAERVFVPIMGFTESTHRPTGIEIAWARARADVAPTSWVLPPQQWRADMGALASLIARHSLGRASIVIAGHSWGVGWGARKLAESLRLRDRIVEVVVSADGVYRDPWMPTWMPLNPLSVTQLIRPRIPLPDNVRRVVVFKQRTGPAHGHTFALSPGTTVEEHVVPGPHGSVDDSPEFIDRAVAEWYAARQACVV